MALDEAIRKAKLAFDSYAGMDKPELPEDATKHNLSKLQVRIHRWQANNFAESDPFLGIVEEVGELSHAILKNKQRIRGFDDQDKFLNEAGDAIADMTVFAMQLCTKYRLDFGVLLQETIEEVLKRDWATNPVDAHKKVG